MLCDMPLEELERYLSNRNELRDCNQFWVQILRESGRFDFDA